MAMRLVHSPTIVSMSQQEQRIENVKKEGAPANFGVPASPAIRPDDGAQAATLPLHQAIGSKLPLYMYPLGPQRTLAEQDYEQESVSSLEDAAVPEYETIRISDAWTGFEELSHTLAADKCKPTCKPAPSAAVPYNTRLYVTDADALDVPTVNNKPGTATDYNQSSNLPQPFLNYTPSRVLSLYTDSMSEDGAMTITPGPSRSASAVFSDMDISPRPSAPPSPALPEGPQMSHVPSTLETVVTSLWDDCSAQGLFRYDVAQCASRVIPGQWGWVAQLNEGRSNKKRPTELRLDAVMQPFDSNKFHFGKAFLREALLQFEPQGLQLAAQQSGWLANDTGARMVESAGMSADPTLVMINVSPIDYGHVLLVPRVLAQQPQQLHHQALAAAMAFVREVGNPAFRLGYNSLGAYATINHLHFQGYFQSAIMPCERAATRQLPGFIHPTVTISTLVDYPVKGWVLAMRDNVPRMAAEADMCQLLTHICQNLQAQDQPYNVLFVEQGTRAFIWPQCYAERQAAGLVPQELLETGVNPAVFEIAGHLVLKRAEDYHAATDGWASRLLAGVSLTTARFSALTNEIMKSISMGGQLPETA